MTRTERVLVAFRLLLEADRPITSRDVAQATGARVQNCAADLALLGKFVPLVEVETGPRRAFALPGRGFQSRAERAYALRARGLPWAEAARRAGYANTSGVRTMAKRYADRAGLPWPPGA